MPIIDSLSPSMQVILRSIRDRQPPTQPPANVSRTLKALEERKMIRQVTEMDTTLEGYVARWELTEVGQWVFVDDAQRHNQPSDFSVGEEVELLDWHISKEGEWSVTVTRYTVAAIGQGKLDPRIALSMGGSKSWRGTRNVRKLPKTDPLSISKLPQTPETELLNHREQRINELKELLRRQSIRTECFLRASRFYHCLLKKATELNDLLYARVNELERKLVAQSGYFESEKAKLATSLDAMQEKLKSIEVYVTEIKFRDDWRALHESTPEGVKYVPDRDDPCYSEWALCSGSYGSTRGVEAIAYLELSDALRAMPHHDYTSWFDYRVRNLITGEVMKLVEGKPPVAQPQTEVAL